MTNSSWVDYVGISKDPRLYAFAEQLEEWEMNQWPKNKFYSFFLNVYNFLTVYTVYSSVPLC